MNTWHGWVVACALACIGVWREFTNRSERKRLESDLERLSGRIDAIESGATYREMQKFCDHAMEIVTGAREDMEAMSAKLAASEARLGAALLDLAQAEERVARLLSAGMR